ncbi:one cut domain family member 2-like [Hetaerina americana]|uniref:one cut domain family member 2-like n=1 Tax=Hetaerina americana TaxID=62018 RepID=UPI003A7F437C
MNSFSPMDLSPVEHSPNNVHKAAADTNNYYENGDVVDRGADRNSDGGAYLPAPPPKRHHHHRLAGGGGGGGGDGGGGGEAARRGGGLLLFSSHQHHHASNHITSSSNPAVTSYASSSSSSSSSAASSVTSSVSSSSGGGQHHPSLQHPLPLSLHAAQAGGGTAPAPPPALPPPPAPTLPPEFPPHPHPQYLFSGGRGEAEDRRNDDEWKNIHVMLNCILSMVEKTKRALAILQHRALPESNSNAQTTPHPAQVNPHHNPHHQQPPPPSAYWLRRTTPEGADGSHHYSSNGAGLTGHHINAINNVHHSQALTSPHDTFKKTAGEIMAQTIKATEDRVAEVKRRAVY